LVRQAFKTWKNVPIFVKKTWKNVPKWIDFDWKKAPKIFVIYLLVVSCKYNWSDKGKGLVLCGSQSPVRAAGS